MRLRLFFFGLIANMTTHYSRIGGAKKLCALVTRFYRSMGDPPESDGIQWILCMNSALRDEVENADLRCELLNACAKGAGHMRNKHE